MGHPDVRYDRHVYVSGGHDAEVRLTLEALVDLANALDASARTDEVRSLLHEHDFSRAAGASAASVRRVEQRLRALLPEIRRLPDASVDDAVDWVNRELASIDLAPSLTTHDDAPLHLHWTPANATFDDQVVADVLMALAQELADTGTRRFGRCAAADCDRLFYDATRNGSRRFCADPRCASRTHTADHRARQRS